MSAIVRVRFGLPYKSEWVQSLSAQDYERLRAIMFDLPEDQSKCGMYHTYDGPVDSEEIAFLSGLGIEVMLKSWRELVPRLVPQEYTGSSVHVHLPGHELMSYTNVVNLDNCCTDELRSHLVDGWRIIAICPQPGQRRPDYILGRK